MGGMRVGLVSSASERDRKPRGKMTGSLTPLGVLWAVCSVIGAVLLAIGFYVPHWLTGQLWDGTPVYLGTFRRCNFPREEEGGITIVSECGRYLTFWDIPSDAWRCTTILTGTSAVASLLVAVTAVLSCCLRDVMGPTVAKVCGVFQGVLAVLTAVAVTVYPAGWSSAEVQQACGGTSLAYRTGTCKVGWAYYVEIVAAVLLAVCVALSWRAAATKRSRVPVISL